VKEEEAEEEEEQIATAKPVAKGGRKAKAAAASSPVAAAAGKSKAAAAAAGAKSKAKKAVPQVKSEDEAEEEEKDADMEEADGQDEEEEQDGDEEEAEAEEDDEAAESRRWAASLPDYDESARLGMVVNDDADEGDSEIEDMGSDDDDDDDGEDDEDEDEQEDDEEDAAGLRTQKPAKSQEKAGSSNEQFGSALSSLLSKPLPQSVLEGRQAPVLLADRTLAARAGSAQTSASAGRAARRLASERRLAKKYMLNKDHRPTPEASPVEKKLMRVATKGVVTLFNAVAKQQKELREAAAAAAEEQDKSKGSDTQQLVAPIACFAFSLLCSVLMCSLCYRFLFFALQCPCRRVASYHCSRRRVPPPCRRHFPHPRRPRRSRRKAVSRPRRT
jgi:hypothetical protein